MVRRGRNTVGETVVTGWRIKLANKKRVAAIAKASGISESYLVDLMVENLPLTDQGIPTWLPEKDRSEELPIEPQ